MEKIKDEKIAFFDEVVRKAIINIFSFSKHCGIIFLRDFDPKRKDHLFFYHCAQLCAQINSFQISSDLNWWQRTIFNWKNRKRIPITRLARVNYPIIKPINVYEITHYMNVCFEGKPYTYADIYDEYWAQKKGASK